MAGYNRAHKAVETIVMCASGSATLLLARRFATSDAIFTNGEVALSAFYCVVAVLLGIASADFVSGFFHWMFDTWWDPDLFLLGPWAIHPFREHHVDPKAITRHDFVHVNGSNFLLAFFVSGPFGFVSPPESPFVCLYLAVFTGFVCFTSQIHKWSHSEVVPKYVHILRTLRLAIEVDHHAEHHDAPYDRSYCITTGWLNRPLQALRFFTTLEVIVTALTGAQPRRDDVQQTNLA
ncbi:MAG TPA: fatty acid desaturase CarF family protein [Polyangiaceae bacterium]